MASEVQRSTTSEAGVSPATEPPLSPLVKINAAKGDLPPESHARHVPQQWAEDPDIPPDDEGTYHCR